MNTALLIDICLLFIGLLLAGTLLCLPLFGWNWQKLYRSSLFTKIIWWIPIFAGMIAILYGGFWVALPISALLLVQASRELTRNTAWKRLSVLVYVSIFTLSLLQLPLAFWRLNTAEACQTLIAICFCSALSDVCAFFAGNYLGNHHLPKALNPKKSWEGVAGQIAGSLLGAWLVVLTTSLHVPVAFAVAIGVASACGDLLNSFTKRKLGIKDWGESIPGHGGVLDRFSSLSLALAVGFWLGL